MKKVLFVATVVRTHINVFHLPYLKWFKDNGYETFVAAKNDFENKENCIVPYCDHYIDINFSRSPLNKNNFLAYKHIKALIEKEEFDIIHCHTPVGGVVTRLAAKSIKSNKPVIIYTAHGFHFYKNAPLKNWIMFYPIERYLSKYTDILITINQEDYEIAQKFSCKKVFLVNGVGVDLDKFSNERKENRISNCLVLLSIGELTRRKNHIIILYAVSKLVKMGYKIEYWICGSGELKEDLENKVKALDLTETVKFLGFTKDVAGVLRKSDIFIFPSLHEGLPVALMEAMASGLPCIVSKIRGNIDLIVDNKGGFCIDNKAEDFIEKIKLLYENPKEMKKFGEFNKQRIKDFSLEIVIEQMENIYDMAILIRK